MVNVAELNTEAVTTWCPGCGNFGILMAVKQAITKLNLNPSNVAMVSGIGCHGKIVDYVRVNGFHGIHGRVLPIATGIKLANHKLTVIGHGGDGDEYAIGFGHFSHAIRRNIDITLVVHNNMVYGLTTGQTAPTSQKGFVTKSTPFGSIELPINPLAIAIASGATFVARGYAGNLKHLVEILVKAIKHKGFSLVDVLQPCVVFNRVNTYDFYNKRVYKLEDDPSYNPHDKIMAFERALEWGDKIPIGVFYEEERPTFEEQLPQLEKEPLIQQSLDNIDISKLLEEFK